MRMIQLLAFTSASALAAACAASAAAQDLPNEPTGLGEIVVTGYRAQNAQAAQVKRDAPGVVEAIVADDVMALPDITLAEALRRVAGVSAEERNGDAQYVVVRGLAREYNAALVDGARLAGTDSDTQTVQLSLIPSTLARRVDIRKTFTAELDGAVVGGATNVVTRSAFDSRAPYFAAQIRGGLFEHDEAVGRKADPSYDANLTFARRFADDRVGVVFAASRRRTESFTHFPGVFSNAWDFYSDDLRRTSPDRYADGVNPDRPVPSGVRQSVYTTSQTRDGLYGKLELRPTDRLSLNLSAFEFNEESLEDRDDHYLYRTPAQELSDVTATSGRVGRARLHVGNDYRIFRNKTNNLALNGAYDFGAGRRLTVLANRSEGSQINPQTEFRFQTDYLPGNAYTYDYSGDYPIFTLVNPATATQPATAPLQHMRFYQYENRETVKAVQANFDDNYQRRDDGFGWRVGASSRRTERERDYDMSELQRAAGVSLFLSQFQRDTVGAAPVEQLVGMPMYLVDRWAMLDYLAANPAAFRSTAAANQDIINDFNIREAVDAGYAAGSFRSGALSLTAGLRYERTEITSSGYQQLSRTGAAASVPYVTEERDYDNWLPSALVEYSFDNGFKLRAAYSKTVGRPTYAQLRVNGTRTVDDSQGTVRLSSGNPDLRAREATNYDLSLEYYPRDFDGAFSLGVFYKDIANEIFTAVDTGTETINGVDYIVTATQPRNALSAKVRGIEAAVLLNDLGQFVPALRNFGVKANLSLLSSDASVLMANGEPRDLYGLRGQPREIANAELFYALRGLELRAVYNHRGRYINSINTTRRFNDQFSNARDVVDLKAKYALGSHVTVFAEARNITGYAQDETWDEDFNRIIYTRDDGRSYWFGVSYRY